MESFSNFRDLGGITGMDGRQVLPCRLLRSGEPVHVSAQDAESLLRDYHLKCIIDLRGSQEAARTPVDTFPGVSYHLLDVMQNAAGRTSSKESLEQLTSPAAVHQAMKDINRLIVTDAHACACYRQFIALLAQQREGATLFHCFAGKDRTGLAAAIILTILGVSRADILADYLRTNTLRAPANAKMLDALRAAGKTQEELEAFSVAMTVHADFLNEAYCAAEETYGSFEAYIAHGLGVSPETAAQLRTMYLAP